jgi:hypothetical protein
MSLNWSQVGSDIDGLAKDVWSGFSVSLSGDGKTLAVVTPLADGLGGKGSEGAANIYTIKDDTWEKIPANIVGGTNDFLRSVSLSNDGTRLAVGSKTETNPSGVLTGSVTIYDKTFNSASEVVWSQVGSTIYGEQSTDGFGNEVRLSGDGSTLIVGAPDNDEGGKDAGKVYIYGFSSNSWVEEYAMTGGGENDNYGSRAQIDLSDDGTVAVIGNTGKSGDSSLNGGTPTMATAGSLWQLRKTDGVWGKGFYTRGNGLNQRLGSSIQVSGDGNTFIVGAYGSGKSDLLGSGSAKVLRHWLQLSDQNRPGWYQINEEIFGENSYDFTGWRTDISSDGSVIAIGSEDFKDQSGQVRIFKDFGDGRWTQIGSSITGENIGDKATQLSLSNNGSTIAIGAVSADSDSGIADTGHTRIFSIKTANGGDLSLTNTNTLSGSASIDDVITSTSNNDFIDGLSGSDTVVFTGNFEDYSISRNQSDLNDLIMVDDLRATENNGFNWLKNIEEITFLDQGLDLSNVDVTKTYSGNFSDYKFYNKGNGLYQIKTDSDYDDLTGCPLLKFSGEASTSSFKEICTIIDIKATFDQVTGLNTDSGEMFRLYNAAFARFPDADGLEYWIDQFSSGRNTRRVVAQSFLGSAEFTEKYGSNVSDETYVNNLYKNVLGRDADTEGLNYWVGNLSSGLETRYEALLGFAESAENKALFTEMTGLG